jgi:hypothetical protein
MRRLVLLALVFLGCAEVQEDELPSATTPPSTVLTKEESAGVVTGSIDGQGTSTQRLAVSQKAEAKDAYVEFPVGSITSDTDVTVQDGDQALGAVGSLPEELGVVATTTIVFAGPPILLTASGLVEPASPYKLTLPLPLTAGSSLQDRSLALAGEGKLALLYLLKSVAGNTIGLQVLSSSDLVGAMLRVQPRRLGWFRVVLLSAKATSVTDKVTIREPAARR